MFHMTFTMKEYKKSGCNVERDRERESESGTCNQAISYQ